MYACMGTYYYVFMYVHLCICAQVMLPERCSCWVRDFIGCGNGTSTGIDLNLVHLIPSSAPFRLMRRKECDD